MTVGHLEAVLCLRCRYVLTILNEAKASLHQWGMRWSEAVMSTLDLLVGLLKTFPTGTATGKGPLHTANALAPPNLLELTQAEKDARDMVNLLTSFDNLQPPSTWVQGWTTLLSESGGCAGGDGGDSGNGQDSLHAWLRLQTGTTGGEGQRTDAPAAVPHHRLKDSSKFSKVPGQAPTAAGARVAPEPQAEAEEEEGAKDVKTSSGHGDGHGEGGQAGLLDVQAQAQAPAANNKPGGLGDVDVEVADMMCVEVANSFMGDIPCESQSLLHLSTHAEALGLQVAEAFSSGGVKALEHKLAAVVWQAFDVTSRKANQVYVDLAASDSKSRVQVARPVPSNMQLPFAGPVTQNPQAATCPNKPLTTRCFVFLWPVCRTVDCCSFLSVTRSVET